MLRKKVIYFFSVETARKYCFSCYIDHDAISCLSSDFQMLNLNNHTEPYEAQSSQ